jgi:PEP-CTERM motif
MSMSNLFLAAAIAAFVAVPAAAYTLPARTGVQSTGTVLKASVTNQPAVLVESDDVLPFVGGNLVVNGSFETSDFSGWEQVGDNFFDSVTDAFAAGGPTDGAWHAAFGSVDPGGGGIIQTIATTPGQIYTLSFDLANLGGIPNAFGLYWDSGFLFINEDLGGFDYITLSGDLVATSSSTILGFVFYHEPSFWFLDNVSLVESVIPEPATWGMMIAGFGLVGSALRRRRIAIA